MEASPVGTDLFHSERQTDRYTGRQTDRQVDRQTGRQTERQTDRQAGRHDEANSRFSQFCERAWKCRRFFYYISGVDIPAM